jgi:predicted membrane chloride channel (bestrophin family)
VVAFLLVSRISQALARFNEARSYLGTMYRETRELISNMAVLTSSPKNSNDASKEWRSEVAYLALIILRTAMAAIDYPSDLLPAWDIPELSGTFYLAPQ